MNVETYMRLGVKEPVKVGLFQQSIYYGLMLNDKYITTRAVQYNNKTIESYE
jgi:hypothetical protein